MPHQNVLDLFQPESGTIYLNSATYGLPPKPTVEALQKALHGWQEGSADWIQDWDLTGEVCRGVIAEMLKADSDEVSLMPAVSVASAIVASAVPDGGEVLVAQGDFTSVLYPFLEQERLGRISVREAPLAELAASIDGRTSMVAVSQVQSSTGELVDLEDVSKAAKAVGAKLYVDVSQALGVVPFDVDRFGADYVACAAYKWLCCPRGVAFLYVRRDRWSETSAVTASWRGGDDPYGRFYGFPLALAETAARYDVSLAWHPWVGARVSLEVLSRLDETTRFSLANGAARHFAECLDLPAPDAGIVSVAVRDGEAAFQALASARVRGAGRAGRVRLAFHIYNTRQQAERVAEVLKPFVESS